MEFFEILDYLQGRTRFEVVWDLCIQPLYAYFRKKDRRDVPDFALAYPISRTCLNLTQEEGQKSQQVTKKVSGSRIAPSPVVAVEEESNKNIPTVQIIPSGNNANVDHNAKRRDSITSCDSFGISCSLTHYNQLAAEIHEEPLALPEKVECLFGNLIAFTSISEGSFSVIPAAIPLVMRINPGSVGPDVEPLPIVTVLINTAIMFLFEALVSDVLVAKYAVRTHARNPVTTVDFLKVWRTRSRTAYKFVIAMICIHVLQINIMLILSPLCIYNQGEKAILTGCPES